MTEADWQACADPRRMLSFLFLRPPSERKLRLVACGCARRVEHLLRAAASRRAVEVAERYADGLADDAELARAYADAQQAAAAAALVPARMVALFTTHKPAWYAANGSVSHLVATLEAEAVQRETRRTDSWARVLAVTGTAKRAAEAELAALLRCVLGNPLRTPALDPAWAAWQGGTAVQLARAIYDERAFDRLPVLADALEEAGCTNAALLAHARGPGPHARGCWAVDLLLGRD